MLITRFLNLFLGKHRNMTNFEWHLWHVYCIFSDSIYHHSWRYKLASVFAPKIAYEIGRESYRRGRRYIEILDSKDLTDLTDEEWQEIFEMRKFNHKFYFQHSHIPRIKTIDDCKKYEFHINSQLPRVDEILKEIKAERDLKAIDNL